MKTLKIRRGYAECVRLSRLPIGERKKVSRSRAFWSQVLAVARLPPSLGRRLDGLGAPWRAVRWVGQAGGAYDAERRFVALCEGAKLKL